MENVTKALLVKKMLGNFKRECIYYPGEEEDAEAQVEIEKLRKKYVLFQAACLTMPAKAKCDVHLTSLKGLERYYKDRCYRGARALRPIVFVLGSLGFVLNLFVISAILSLKRLRRMLAFLLIAHLSFCDFLTGVYALGTASGHEVSPDFHEIRQYRESNSKCTVFWVIFLLGQTLGVLTCLLVTIERYIATVYCMKPDLKLETRTAMIILSFFWVLALLIAFPLQLIDYQKITINFMCVLLRDYSAKKGFFVSQGLMIAFLILYVIVVFLYCRIYVFVRNSSRQVSVKREAKLAKRIGVIVLTNFVCFALPNLSMLLFTTVGLYAPLDDIPNTIIRRWVPPMFLVLNACANPLLFALGNNTFSSSVKQAVRPFLVRYLGLSTVLQKTSRVHPTGAMKTMSTAATTASSHHSNGCKGDSTIIESQA
ncbi:hypothetical protein QZH41_005702 [Actinostola sp. cb2023]|nr:hypothetical protein QZH41_005702 [Actinostola sp. cb2023]